MTSPRSSSSPFRARACSSRPTTICATAAELCHRHGALLAVDEVQTGLGRTGSFFAFEQWNVEPDLVTVAKALSGGYVPVGAVIAKSEVVEKVFDKMDRAVVHSSTFGQNVLAMTAGLATLHTIDAESIVERARDRRVAHRGPAQSVAAARAHPRGARRGLMIGIEFRRPRSMRLRAQWTLLETMRTGLFTQLVIVPLFRDHGILTQVAGRPSERAQDPAAAHHDRGAGRVVRRRARRRVEQPRTVARAAARRRSFAGDPRAQGESLISGARATPAS